jgi:hypothetical protein
MPLTLTDTEIRSLKPSDKPFKISDSHDLYLLIKLGRLTSLVSQVS